jgi:hypothetical protein
MSIFRAFHIVGPSPTRPCDPEQRKHMHIPKAGFGKKLIFVDVTA